MAKKKRPAGKKSGTKKFKYHERTAEAVKQRADQTGGRFDSYVKQGVDMWRPNSGQNTVRILEPTWEGHEHYGYDLWLHGFVGPDNSTYLCPKKMLNKKCPICEAHQEAKRAGEEDEAKALAPTRRVAVWVIDRDDDKESPQLWTMGWTMDRDIAALSHDRKSGRVLLIDHPYEGYDVSFQRQGQGLKTRYIGLQIDRDKTAISEDEEKIDEIREYIHENPIPSILNYYDEDYLRQVIEANVDERDEDLDEDEDEDEAENDDNEEDEDEEDEDEAENDDNEEDEDEEDEDEGEEEEDLEDEDEDEDEGEEEEEEPAPKKGKKGKTKTSRTRRESRTKSTRKKR